MGVRTLDRALAHDDQTSTESLLRGQLDQLKKLIELKPDPNVASELVRMREKVRNHLSALLLRDDPEFREALGEVLTELQNGDAPRGLVDRNALRELLDL